MAEKPGRDQTRTGQIWKEHPCSRLGQKEQKELRGEDGELAVVICWKQTQNPKTFHHSRPSCSEADPMTTQQPSCQPRLPVPKEAEALTSVGPPSRLMPRGTL